VTAEFYLTQIVSHHSRPAVERFLEEAARRGLELPGMFGVFYYRSANPKTLNALNQFLPVPVAELQAEFAAGVRHFYVSNLPIGRAALTLHKILSLV
jgi:hypothetical protein